MHCVEIEKVYIGILRSLHVLGLCFFYPFLDAITDIDKMV